jgi:hypothetical protein
VKHVVDSPRHREIEFECDRGDPFDDLEGSLTFWGEFRRLIWEFEVGGFQPHVLSLAELVFRRSRVFQGLIDGLHRLCSFLDHLIDVGFGGLVVGSYHLDRVQDGPVS